MEDFLRSCVSRYQELTGVGYMRKAQTPFLDEPTAPDFTDGYNTTPTEMEVNAAESALREAAGGATCSQALCCQSIDESAVCGALREI